MATPDEAVTHLIQRLNAPSGAVVISIWYDGSAPIIRVSPTKGYDYLATQIPAEIDGYDIEYWQIPNISLH